MHSKRASRFPRTSAPLTSTCSWHWSNTDPCLLLTARLRLGAAAFRHSSPCCLFPLYSLVDNSSLPHKQRSCTWPLDAAASASSRESALRCNRPASSRPAPVRGDIPKVRVAVRAPEALHAPGWRDRVSRRLLAAPLPRQPAVHPRTVCGCDHGGLRRPGGALHRSSRADIAAWRCHDANSDSDSDRSSSSSSSSNNNSEAVHTNGQERVRRVPAVCSCKPWLPLRRLLRPSTLPVQVLLPARACSMLFPTVFPSRSVHRSDRKTDTTVKVAARTRTWTTPQSLHCFCDAYVQSARDSFALGFSTTVTSRVDTTAYPSLDTFPGAFTLDSSATRE